MIKRILFFVLFIQILTSYAQEINEVIHPVKLTAGKIDTILISDLFYTDNYENIKFDSNKHLKINFDSKTNKIVFLPVKDFQGYISAEFNLNDERFAFPVLVLNPQKDNSTIKHKFSYKAENKVGRVSVFGSFNGWNRDSHLMKDVSGKGDYEIVIPLEPGDYEYKLKVDDKEIIDPLNPETVPAGFDNFNSSLKIDPFNYDKTFLHTLGKKEIENQILFQFYLEEENSKVKIQKNQIIAFLDNKKIDYENIKINKNRIDLELQNDEVNSAEYLRIAVSDNGRISNFVTVFLKEEDKNDKSNWHNGIIYSIMIDRFNDGDKFLNDPVVHDSIFYQANYQGGDLQGIINKIDEGYFDSLGINILWISPVYDNPNTAFREYPAPYRWYSGYHGYWPISDNKVDDHFGTMDLLKELINKAHDKDIRVLLDFVANHTHADHPLYKEHPDWFGTLELPDGRKNLRLWDEYRLTTWFEPYMPSFDYSNKAALNYMTDNAVWWLKRTGADGFRHDAVKHVPNEFWRELTRKIKSEIEIPENKKVYQIGETFGSYELVGSYVNNGQLSSQFNFNLSYFSIPIFTEKDKSFKVLDFQMNKTFMEFGYNNIMGNIMDSHDKIRFMAYADGDVLQQGIDTREMAWSNPPTVDDEKSYDKGELFYAFMLTVPGLPVIYYGSEFGMTGADDPDNRRFMRFGDELNSEEKEMLGKVSNLIKIRNQHSALKYGDFITVVVEDNIYSYIRSDVNEKILVVLNKSGNKENFNLNIPEFYEIKTVTDLISGNEFEISDNTIKIDVDDFGYRIIKLNQ